MAREKGNKDLFSNSISLDIICENRSYDHATLCERFYLCERFAEFTGTVDGEDRQIGATQFDISVRGYH